jgi:hypothetical protein
VACQRALDSHPWPDCLRVRVRIGIHTSEPAVEGEGYAGCERDEEGIAPGVDLVPAVLVKCRAQEGAVVREGIGVALPQGLQETGRPFDVRDEKGDRAAGELAG